jgi:hypothetical protein
MRNPGAAPRLYRRPLRYKIFVERVAIAQRKDPPGVIVRREIPNDFERKFGHFGERSFPVHAI